MKKILSVLLVILMLLAVMWLPMTVAAATEFIGDTYYKFTFGEEGATRGSYTMMGKETYKGNSFTTTPYSESRQADVVVIYLGTNDNSGLGGINTDAKVNELANGMKLLIERVKSYNPNARIVWVSGGMTNKYREAANKAITECGGSENGYYLCDVPNSLNAGENGHPDASQQRLISKTLQEFLKANVLD